MIRGRVWGRRGIGLGLGCRKRERGLTFCLALIPGGGLCLTASLTSPAELKDVGEGKAFFVLGDVM
jgi:hypothetical protein